MARTVQAKLFEVELFNSMDLRHRSLYPSLWLPDSKIQAHKANGRWVVQRADFPERAVGAVTDITVSALWASAIETLMAATDTVNAANDHATLLSDDAVPLP